MVKFVLLSLIMGICTWGCANEMAHDAVDRALHGVRFSFSNIPMEINEDLQAEILFMAAEDQAARSKLAGNISEENVQAIIEIDQKHHQRLGEMITEYGWPGIRSRRSQRHLRNVAFSPTPR